VPGGQVTVIGLVAGIDRLALLLGDERVENAGLEAGGGEGALHHLVIVAGPFAGDEAIAEVMSGKGLAELGDGGVEVGSGRGNDGGRDKGAALAIGEEELGADLGTVEADAAEVVGADALHAGMEHAAGFAQGGFGTPSRGASAGRRRSHRTGLHKKREGLSHICRGQVGKCRLLRFFC
jgi:hypothetical protein